LTVDGVQIPIFLILMKVGNDMLFQQPGKRQKTYFLGFETILGNGLTNCNYKIAFLPEISFIYFPKK